MSIIPCIYLKGNRLLDSVFQHRTKWFVLFCSDAMDKAMCRENVGVILLLLDKYQHWSQKGENGFQRSLSHPVIPYSASCFQMVPPNYTL